MQANLNDFRVVHLNGLNGDQHYMSRCIELARQGGGDVLPNPMVGAVLVHEGTTIGEGYHERYGALHAEPNAINAVPSSMQHLIPFSTLYVSLEPCAHYGKTPPCADLIIKHKIPKVVIGCKDIFAKVNGQGIQKLREAGVATQLGVLEKECIDLNKRFFTFHGLRRPWVLLKWAETSNGKIGNIGNNRLHITGSKTDLLVHKWRSEEGAIMIGTQTALLDNPKLTNRHWKGPQPIRVVIDKQLRLPGHLHLFDLQSPTIVLNELKESKEENLSYLKINGTQAEKAILEKLFELNISSVLIEGGARFTQSFIDAGLWDEARVITNDTLTLDEGVDAPVLSNQEFISSERTGNDRLTYYRRNSKNVG